MQNQSNSRRSWSRTEANVFQNVFLSHVIMKFGYKIELVVEIKEMICKIYKNIPKKSKNITFCKKNK